MKQVLQLRGGYVASPTGDALPNGFKKEYILGPTFGFGLNVPMGSMAFQDGLCLWQDRVLSG